MAWTTSTAVPPLDHDAGLASTPPDPECTPLAAASALGRGFVLQCQGWFHGGQTPKLLGIAHDRAGVAMRLGPRSELGEESVHVITGLRDKLIFDLPGFFER